MKNMAKKITALLLTFVLLLSASTLLMPTAFATDLSSGGQCGENVYYTFNEATGLLTISGTGEMYDIHYSGNSPFINNGKIKNVIIEDGVTSICFAAFWYCGNLTGITIPKSVINIYDGSMFGGCSNLEHIVVDAKNPVYDSRDNCNAIIETASNTLIAGCKNTDIPNSVTSIGEAAFYYCTGLTSITIPNSVTSIGGTAFWGCESLTSITIPNSVTIINGNILRDCDALTSINVNPGNKILDSRDNCNAIIDTASNTLIAGCRNTVIPNSVTSIGNSAFDGCESLTSIAIPNSVTSIGNYAFDGCKSLTSIAIPNSVTSIEDGAFVYCWSLTSITIPNSVTSIGEYAFHSCEALTDVYYTGTQSQWNAITIGSNNEALAGATIHFNAVPKQTAPLADGSLSGFSAQYPDGAFSEDVSLLVTPSVHSDLPAMGITLKGNEGVTEYNICMVNGSGDAVQPQSGKSVTLRLPIPQAYKGRAASQFTIYHYMETAQGKLERFSVSKGNLRVFGDYLEIDVSHFSPFVLVVEAPTVTIRNNPGSVILHFGESVVLHADAENLPEDASLVWTADGNGFVTLKPSEDGTSCEVISAKTGTAKVSVKVVDADGEEIPFDGNAAETVQSKAGLFWKFIAAFRSFFKIAMRREQESACL